MLHVKFMYLHKYTQGATVWNLVHVAPGSLSLGIPTEDRSPIQGHSERPRKICWRIVKGTSKSLRRPWDAPQKVVSWSYLARRLRRPQGLDTCSQVAQILMLPWSMGGLRQQMLLTCLVSEAQSIITFLDLSSSNISCFHSSKLSGLTPLVFLVDLFLGDSTSLSQPFSPPGPLCKT